MFFARTAPGVLLLALWMTTSHADEGMWTFNNFPADKVEKTYGFRPDRAWLDHVRLSSVRLTGRSGCSAAFVSPRGLVQTNHHCARRCIQDLSTPQSDLATAGFYAREEKDETRCPGLEVNQLIDISDVTDRVTTALAGKDGPAFAAALRAERANIASECAGNDDNLRCDVISLYSGGVYNLYKYRRYQDVRLVFAPEGAIAFFGGDPDNFEFPRYDFDLSYLRVYSDGRPLDTAKNFLRYSKTDVQPGDLTFTSGHPGSTDRLDTVAQLEFRRDVRFPRLLIDGSEWRGILTEFSRQGPEQARIAEGELFGVENSLKALKGHFYALVESSIIKDHAAAERELRAKVDADPRLKAQYGAAWDDLQGMLRRWRQGLEERIFLGPEAFISTLFSHALTLVRYPVEIKKSNDLRLPEFSEARSPALRQRMFSTAPIYPELEKLRVTSWLTKMREYLGPDHAFVRKVLGKKSPAQLATELVDGTKLADAGLRKQLLEGGQAAVDASNDPMIAFARMVDADMRAVRKDIEDNLDAPLTKYRAQIAQARFQVYGTSSYPDATFTLRMSYGSVAGYPQDGKTIAPITMTAGLFERATGAAPYQLPESWLKAQPMLNPNRPFNFVTTNDIVGGNSGSPIVNKAGEVVGLVFDGNRQSLGGTYGYDISTNRTVAVNVGIMREALAVVYRADRILRELDGPVPNARP
jgi:Peptidase S46